MFLSQAAAVGVVSMIEKKASICMITQSTHSRELINARFHLLLNQIITAYQVSVNGS